MSLQNTVGLDHSYNILINVKLAKAKETKVNIIDKVECLIHFELKMAWDLT